MTTLPRTAAASNAAQETVTAIDAQEDRNGGSTDRHTARRSDSDQRGLRFNPPSPRPAESRCRPGTVECRNGREARLVEFAGIDDKGDSDDSGDM